MKPTVEDLKKGWWWREVDPGKPFHPKHWAISNPPECKSGVESAAFQWELARRHDDAPNLPPFVDLPEPDAMKYVYRFGKSQNFWIETQADSMDFQAGYSRPSVWPLHLPDHALETRFHKFIAEQRAEQNIARKRGRASELSKGPAWRNVELLDLAKHGIRKKSTVALGSNFDKRRYFEARTRCNEAWRVLKASGLLLHYLGR